MSTKGKTAIVFISGSAGELDWILPILNYLLKKNFNIKIIFLTRHSLKSVEENRMCNDFIKQKDTKIEIVILGGYFFEKIERFGYLSYRLFLKLKLLNVPLIKTLYNLYDSLQKFIFMKHLPSEILNSEEEGYLFISEFPSLRRPRDIWIKRKFKQSTFFYCPHSPHIYTEELDREYKESNPIDFNQKSFLLLGHPSDYDVINDGKELAATDLEKLFIGHPKYSQSWLQNLKQKAKEFRETYATRQKINILILGRGYGSYLDKDSHIHLVNSTIRIIENLIPEHNLLIKKHPREISSQWDEVLGDHPSIEIVNEHILQLATKVDFAISFWGSGSMDCFMLEVPVIEYWDPAKHHKQQIPDNDSFTTIYRKLGIVLPANNEQELSIQISSLLNNNYNFPSNDVHPFFSQLITRSNKWIEVIDQVLSSNGLSND